MSFNNYQNKIIAIDFDGCLVVDQFPLIGEPNEKLIKLVSQWRENGCQIILWTCRNGAALDNAVGWCASRGIKFDAVNENLESVKALYGGDTRKIFADVYIDDKSRKWRFTK